MAAMVRDLPEAEEDLPEMDRDLTCGTETFRIETCRQQLRTKERIREAACSQEEKKSYHLWHRDRSDPGHGSSTVSGNDTYQ